MTADERAVIAAFLEWVEEGPGNADRDESILSGIREILSQPTYCDATDWVIQHGWTRSRDDARRLLDAVWKHRDSLKVPR